jgi:hypothetical protein
LKTLVPVEGFPVQITDATADWHDSNENATDKQTQTGIVKTRIVAALLRRAARVDPSPSIRRPFYQELPAPASYLLNK